MKVPQNILRSRVRALARFWVLMPLAMTAGMLVLDRVLEMHSGDTHQHMAGAKVLAFYLGTCGIPAMVGCLASLYGKLERFPRPLVSVPSLVRVPIAKAAHNGSITSVIEGRVARAAEEREIASPLSGARCVYYRVRVETWKRVPQGDDPWSEHFDRRQLVPFVVADDSGFVLIKPDQLADADVEQNLHYYKDPVEVDHRISSRVTIHKSRSGVPGLPPQAREYIEANREHLPFLKDDQRVRVTEMLLREGDLVSVIGVIKAQAVRGAAYREYGSERMLVMGAYRPRVYPARLDELRWLVAFHRWLTLALVVGGIIGLAAVVLGFAGMFRR